MKYRILIPLVTAAACGDTTDPPDPPARGRLAVVNQSQYELDQLRVHADLDYGAATNQLVAALPIDGRHVVEVGGDVHVTIFRVKYEGGPTIALTTAEPIDVPSGETRELTVFDEVFRLKTNDR